jgi:NADH-quinone oxidoreductase subunit E
MAHPTSQSAPGTDISDIDELLERFSPSPGIPLMSMLIPVLQKVQERYGWLPREALEKVGEKLRLPISKIYGVVTFYAQFYLEPRGRHVVRCCRGTACHVRGAAAVMTAIEESLGVGDGETTPDMQFTVETVACLGACALAPVMLIDETYHGKMTSSSVRKLLDDFQQGEAGGGSSETAT